MDLAVDFGENDPTATHGAAQAIVSNNVTKIIHDYRHWSTSRTLALRWVNDDESASGDRADPATPIILTLPTAARAMAAASAVAASASRFSGRRLILEGCDSQALWRASELLDSQVALRVGGSESPSISVKRLARRLRLVLMPSSHADFESCRPDYVVELLKGMAFEGDIALEWSTPDDVGKAIARVREELARPAVVLTAYRGDRRMPRLASSRHSP